MTSNTPVPRSDGEPSRMPWLSFWTFGLATPFIFIYIVGKKPTQTNKTALGVYTGALLLPLCTFGLAAPLIPLVLWGVGTVHLFMIRNEIWPTDGQASIPSQTMAYTAIDHVAQARQQRDDARSTAVNDPMLAKKMAIGRPDLDDRAVEDGGLVDVNHAPADALTTLPGITPQVAEDIVDYRESHGSFANFDELVFAVQVNPKFESQLKEYAIFIP